MVFRVSRYKLFVQGTQITYQRITVLLLLMQHLRKMKSVNLVFSSLFHVLSFIKLRYLDMHFLICLVGSNYPTHIIQMTPPNESRYQKEIPIIDEYFYNKDGFNVGTPAKELRFLLFAGNYVNLTDTKITKRDGYPNSRNLTPFCWFRSFTLELSNDWKKLTIKEYQFSQEHLKGFNKPTKFNINFNQTYSTMKLIFIFLSNKTRMIVRADISNLNKTQSIFRSEIVRKPGYSTAFQLLSDLSNSITSRNNSHPAFLYGFDSFKDKNFTSCYGQDNYVDTMLLYILISILAGVTCLGLISVSFCRIIHRKTGEKGESLSESGSKCDSIYDIADENDEKKRERKESKRSKYEESLRNNTLMNENIVSKASVALPNAHLSENENIETFSSTVTRVKTLDNPYYGPDIRIPETVDSFQSFEVDTVNRRHTMIF